MPSKASISASLFQLHPGERFRYRYNFFVFWERELRLEAAVALHGKLAHPRCVGGRRPAPDEARFVSGARSPWQDRVSHGSRDTFW